VFCYNCGAHLTEHEFCTNCGADVYKYKRIMSSANLFYNEGLERATVRDLSGAITALRQSLKLNKNHVDARNLLGLVYFEMGEYVAALSEWVISKNTRPEKNIADDYLEMMQANPSRLDTISQTVKKYNQALSYCYQGSHDLAIIQLKKVLSLNPKHVQGHQLLALLYLNAEQYADAKKELEKCQKIDVNNTTTLRYLKEACAGAEIDDVLTTEPKKKKKDIETVTYKRGNETIIQPLNGRDTKATTTVINIIIGIIIGVLVAWLLILPSRISAANEDKDIRLKEVSEELDAKNASINSLEQEKNSLNTRIEKLQTELSTYTGENGTMSAMDNLLNAAKAYMNNPEDVTTVASYLDQIDEMFVSQSTETYSELYYILLGKVGNSVSNDYYESGLHAYQNEDFETAISDLKKAYAYDASNVDALFHLANSYRRIGDEVTAVTYYQTLIDSFPDTELATRAQTFINELNDE